MAALENLTPDQIPPERMKLVKKGSPDWERNI